MRLRVRLCVSLRLFCLRARCLCLLSCTRPTDEARRAWTRWTLALNGQTHWTTLLCASCLLCSLLALLTKRSLSGRSQVLHVSGHFLIFLCSSSVRARCSRSGWLYAPSYEPYIGARNRDSARRHEFMHCVLFTIRAPRAAIGDNK